jgi:hypothetical protein
MIQHFRFVRGHHRRIRKVAFVTDAHAAVLAEKIGSHFQVPDETDLCAATTASVLVMAPGDGVNTEVRPVPPTPR